MPLLEKTNVQLLIINYHYKQIDCRKINVNFKNMFLLLFGIIENADKVGKSDVCERANKANDLVRGHPSLARVSENYTNAGGDPHTLLTPRTVPITVSLCHPHFCLSFFQLGPSLGSKIRFN